jgi:hypothetical protein
MRIRYVVWLATTLAFVGCGKSGIGESCDSNSDCADGMSCILYGGKDIGPSGPECVDKKLCSITCTKDTDCASLGTGLICVNDCHEGSCLVGSRGSSP